MEPAIGGCGIPTGKLEIEATKTEITRGNNNIRLEEMEEKLKGLLEKVEQFEARRKLAREVAHSYSPPPHSDGFYGLEQWRLGEKPRRQQYSKHCFVN